MSYETINLTTVRYGIEKIDGLDIFYREAGDPSKKAVVLLHLNTSGSLETSSMHERRGKTTRAVLTTLN